MKPITQRVGRITVALGLILFGVALLLDNFSGELTATSWVYRLWPMLLIGFGLEYLVRTVLVSRRSPDDGPVNLRFDYGGAFLLLLIFSVSAGVHTFRGLVVDGPGRISFIGGPSISQTQSKLFPLNDAKEVVVSFDVGTVVIEQGTSSNEVKVEVSYTVHGLIINEDKVWKEIEEVQMTSTSGSVLQLESKTPSTLNNVSIRYVVSIPPSLKVTVNAGAGRIQVPVYHGDLDLRSNVGTITVDTGVGSLKANAGAGSIIVRNFDGPVNARTNVGSMTVSSVGGDVELHSGTGTITINEFHSGSLIAETRTGSVSASTSSVLGGNVLLKTSAGSITLSVPRDSSMRATAQTRAGSVTLPSFMTTSDQSPAPAKSGVGTNGTGTHSVTLEAGTGQVNFSTR